MTVFNDIRTALETEIASITGIPASRAWENVVFRPVTGTPFVRMTLAPSASRPAVRGPSPQIRHDGLFLVDVVYPINEATASADTLADNIRAAYTVDDTFTSGSTTVRINYAERGPGFIDGNWYRVPVTISWFSYASS